MAAWVCLLKLNSVFQTRSITSDSCFTKGTNYIFIHGRLGWIAFSPINEIRYCFLCLNMKCIWSFKTWQKSRNGKKRGKKTWEIFFRTNPGANLDKKKAIQLLLFIIFVSYISLLFPVKISRVAAFSVATENAQFVISKTNSLHGNMANSKAKGLVLWEGVFVWPYQNWFISQHLLLITWVT